MVGLPGPLDLTLRRHHLKKKHPADPPQDRGIHHGTPLDIAPNASWNI
jgi:hypothetical protein